VARTQNRSCLDDEARVGSYGLAGFLLLQFIESEERLLPVPKGKSDMFILEVMVEINKNDEKKYCTSDCGTEIEPVAVGKNQANQISRYFICVWTVKEKKHYIKRVLYKCRSSLNSFWPKCKVHFVLPKTRKASLFSRSVKSNISTEYIAKDAVEESTPELFCGQRLYGFRNNVATFSITLGGFISISGIPFIITAGHLLESSKDRYSDNPLIGSEKVRYCSDLEVLSDTDEFLEPSDYETDTWDPNDDLSESDEESSTIEVSTDDLDTLQMKEGNVIFRVSKDPESPIVGIECYNPYYKNCSLETSEFCNKSSMEISKFSDDWCIIIPAPGVNILGNNYTEGTLSNGKSVGKVNGFVAEEDIYVNKRVKILGSKGKQNQGIVSSLATALKLPGDESFSQAWKLTLDHAVGLYIIYTRRTLYDNLWKVI
jgi:hypothetical protein